MPAIAKARSALLLFLVGVALGGPVRLNAGGAYLPAIGWRADTGAYASPNSVVFTGGGPIEGTGSWKPVYESHRWAPTGNLEFQIPVPDGNFDMALMFAETWSGSGIGVRQMKVKINDVAVTQAGPGGLLDVFDRANGLNKRLYLNVPGQASVSGNITVTLERVAGKNNPMISGIAIFGATADQLVGNEGIGGGGGGGTDPTCASGNSGTVLKMNVGGGVIAGLDYVAEDTDLINGMLGETFSTETPMVVPDGADDAAVYQSERFTTDTTLAYKIAVAEAGAYTVKTLHSESFLDSAGARVFNLNINGQPKNQNVDICDLKGMNQALILENTVMMAAAGDITIEFVKVTENPLVNGIIVTGCLGNGGNHGPGEATDDVTVPHYAHPVSGGPYVATDFDKDDKATLVLDGTNSHSHAIEGGVPGQIQVYRWTWTDAGNPDAVNGVVTKNTATVSAVFPRGTTNIEIFVQDQYGNTAKEDSTLQVLPATVPGAYCYKYNLGSANPTSVDLPVNVDTNPRPNKAGNVGDINFGDTAAFQVPFAANAFYVRCVYSVDLPADATLSYQLVHSGPFKIYHNGTLWHSSPSLSPNTVTNIPEKYFTAGIQNWQIHYLRKPSTEGKLILQDSGGAVLSDQTVGHDASATLPLITGLSQSTASEEGSEIVAVYGTAFVNQVSIFVGNEEAETAHVNAGTIEVIVPAGTGIKMVKVTTAAGTSNEVPLEFVMSPPVNFAEDYVRNSDGTKKFVKAPAIAVHGPDYPSAATWAKR